MAQLIVRSLEDQLVARLKERARAHGHSAEEEHRTILRDALFGDGPDFKEYLCAMPNVGDDQDFDGLAGEARAPDFDSLN